MPPNALRRNQTELAELATQGIYQHGSLTNEQFARPMEHQTRLLLDAFHVHKAHGRSRDRLADCLRIEGVVLASLDVRPDITCRHQPDSARA